MKLGLVCISEILKSRDKNFAFRTMTRKQFNSLDRNDALTLLSQRILHNCRLMKLIIRHCAQSGIAHYRVSSNLFPLVTDTTLNISYEDLPDIKKIKAELASCREGLNHITCSSHPDQFNVLASLNPDVVNRTISELNHQARVMDWMGLPQDHSAPMCLHLALSPKSVDEVGDFISRFYAAFNLCDDGVKRRLVLENEDKGYWNSKNLFDTFGGDFPLVFDNLHHECNPCEWDHVEACDQFVSTWGAYTPVFHWSEGIAPTDRRHADSFSYIPQIVLENPNIIFECEVKQKDIAITNLLDKTP